MMAPTSLLYYTVCVLAWHLTSAAPAADCDNHAPCPNDPYMTHYRELGCEAVFSKDSPCCPASFDCSKRSLLSADKCHYGDRELSVGETIPDEQTPPCLVHCRCQISYLETLPSISCVSVECPELFMGSLNQPECVRQYTDDQCCSTNTFCAPDNSTLAQVTDMAKCEYEGKTYIQGQKFYPDEQPCMTCICQQGFKGKLEEPFCRQAPCNMELHYASQLRRKCVPVYYKDRCCPIDWRCPDEVNNSTSAPAEKSPLPGSVSTPAPQVQPLECEFGSRRFAVGETLASENPGDCVHCACAVPPVLTCVKDYSDCDSR